MSDSTADTADSTAKPAPPKPPPRRRSRIWRIVKWTLLVLVLVILVLLALVAWVAGTDSGTEFAWNQVKGHLPGNIRIASVQGRLIGPLHIRGIRYDTDAMQARVKSVDFNMDASDLLSLTVHIRKLAVAGVNYKVTKAMPPPSSKKPAAPFSLPKAIKLPVAVQIDRVTVDDVTAMTAPKAKPVMLDHAQLVDAHLDNAQWRIKSLTANGPMFALDAQARATPSGGYATHLDAHAKLRLPDLAPIAAKAEIKGSLKNLHLSATVDAPYNVALNGRIRNALKKPLLDARIHVKNLHTQAIRKSLPKVAASADVTARGPLDDLALTATSHVDSADYGKVDLDAALGYQPQAVTIDHLKLTLPASGGALTAKGQVALAKGNAMNLNVDWSDLAWPLSGKAAYRSNSGRLHLTGPLDDYQLDSSLVWQVVGQAKGKLALKGSGSTQVFNLASLDVSGGPGHITGHAKARWSPALDVSAHLQGSHINPGAIVAKVPGDFNLVADVTASRKNGVLNAHVKTLTAKGSLRHQPLDLNARLAYLGSRVKIDVLHLVTGATTADVSGVFGLKHGDRLDGKWSIHSTDLATVMPGLAGSIQTDGRVSGTVAAPDLNAKLRASDLEAYGNKVARARLDAHVDWSGKARSKVDLAADGIQAGGQSIHKVRLNLDGTPASHRLSLDMDSAIAKASLALVGHLDKKTYRERFTLNKLHAAYQKLAPWSLSAPASGVVSARAQSIKNACLNSGGARLCLTGSHDAKASVGHIKLSNFAYDYAKTFFPEGMGVTGAISGTVDARVPAGGSPDVNLDLHTTAGHVSMTNPQGATVQVLDMAPGRIRAKMRNNGVNASVSLPLNGSSGVQAKVDVAAGKGALTTHALSGHLRLSLAALDFINKLSPEVAAFDGNIKGDLRLSGTVAKPIVRGNAAINASKIVLVTPGLTLTGVRLAAVGHGNSIGIQAVAKSGGGNLHAQGSIALNDNGQAVDLTVKGDRFQIANIPEAKAYVSPDLSLKVAPRRIDVTGSVTIPEASITPRNLPAAGVTTVSSDQVIVSNKPPAKKAVARAIHANVKVILGKKVHVAAFGLKADLAGSLRVVQEPGNVPTGSGAINIVNGSYRAYGQNLDIQKGKILFAGGPVSEPGLDFKAARYPNNNVTVGVQVQGTIKKPKLTLFSTPTMTQSEILSWLLLGRPLDSTNGQQSSVVARAALALGSSKGSQYLQDIGSKLGLDNVGIGAPPGEGGAGQDTGKDSTALTVGKYLSPRLYIGYGLGLFDQVSTVYMRYTLSSHWQLKTSSSSKATGGDIIYSIDR